MIRYNMAPRKTPQAPKAPRKPRTAKPSTSTPKNIYRATTKVPPRLQEILDDFKTPDQVHFDPFQPETPTRKGQANLPSSFPLQAEPIHYFNLFFTDDLWKTITINSNQYAAFQQRQNIEERRREWRDLILDELRVFVGATIYIGVHQELQIKDHWNIDSKSGPIHPISYHISLRRYEQIKRYLHISNTEEDIRQQYSSTDRWWYKLEPLASSLQRSFSQFYIPGSKVSIDEVMVRCFGASSHTYKMPDKPISEGYKIFALAEHGYIYSFIWSSRVKGMPKDIILRPGLTPTGSMVRTLAHTLPRHGITIYLDNYFTSVPLFEELRLCQFGAIGTTRPHSTFPQELVEVKKRFAKKLEWNTLLARVVKNTLCMAWQDNNIVLALSNVHTVHTAKDWVTRVRKRPSKTSTNAQIVRDVFGNNALKELPIPSFINDYNHFMGGVDIANQYRQPYELHRPTLRNWFPLFYWLVDVICVNAYRLYVLHIKAHDPQIPLLSHLQFRTKLYLRLLEYSKAVQLTYLQVSLLPGRRVFGSDQPHIHFWARRPTRISCRWCQYKLQRDRLEGIVGIGARVKKSDIGCQFCDVTLCRDGSCWVDFHSSRVN